MLAAPQNPTTTAALPHDNRSGKSRRGSRFDETPPTDPSSAQSNSPTSEWEPSPETLEPPIFDPQAEEAADPAFPSPHAFALLVHDYLKSLSKNKFEKALLSQEMYDRIFKVLREPNNTRQETAQFRFWVKKMFHLAESAAHEQVVCHDHKPVAVREQIYEVLVHCHREAGHGGRDKTSTQVRRYYSWIPKEIIARFVRECPVCQSRRTHSTPGGVSSTQAFFRSLQEDQNAQAARDRRVVSLAQARAKAAAMGHVPHRRRSHVGPIHVIGGDPRARRGSAVPDLTQFPYAPHSATFPTYPFYAQQQMYHQQHHQQQSGLQQVPISAPGFIVPPSTSGSVGPSVCGSGVTRLAPPPARRVKSYDERSAMPSSSGLPTSASIDMDRRATESNLPTVGGYDYTTSFDLPYASAPMIRDISTHVSPSSAMVAQFDNSIKLDPSCHSGVHQAGWSEMSMDLNSMDPLSAVSATFSIDSTTHEISPYEIQPTYQNHGVGIGQQSVVSGEITGWEPDRSQIQAMPFDRNNVFDVGSLHGLDQEQVATLQSTRPQLLASLQASIPRSEEPHTTVDNQKSKPTSNNFGFDPATINALVFDPTQPQLHVDALNFPEFAFNINNPFASSDTHIPDFSHEGIAPDEMPGSLHVNILGPNGGNARTETYSVDICQAETRPSTSSGPCGVVEKVNISMDLACSVVDGQFDFNALGVDPSTWSEHITTV